MLNRFSLLLMGFYLLVSNSSEMKMKSRSGAGGNHQIFDGTRDSIDQLSTDYSNTRDSSQQLSSHSDALKRDRMHRHYVHEVIITAAHQNNTVELARLLHDVSNPSSPNYGQHWTREEVTELTSYQEARDAVVLFLYSHGESSVCKLMVNENDELSSHSAVTLWGKVFGADYYLEKKDGDDSVPTAAAPSPSESYEPTGSPTHVLASSSDFIPSLTPTFLSSLKHTPSPTEGFKISPSSAPTLPSSQILPLTPTTVELESTQFPSLDEGHDSTPSPTATAPSPFQLVSSSPSLLSQSPSVSPNLSPLPLPLFSSLRSDSPSIFPSSCNPSSPSPSMPPTSASQSEKTFPTHKPLLIPVVNQGDPTSDPSSSFLSILQASQVCPFNINIFFSVLFYSIVFCSADLGYPFHYLLCLPCSYSNLSHTSF